MKTYSCVKLKFTRGDIINKIEEWKGKPSDVFDEQKIDLAVKSLTLNRLNINYIDCTEQEFKELENSLIISIDFYFIDGNPNGLLINFDFCEVQVEAFPDEIYLKRAVVEN
jgi:hypothetical protein